MSKNTLSQAQDSYWYGYASRLPIMLEFRRYGDVIDLPITVDQALHELQNGAFAAGARWAMRESSVLSPHIAKFIEMMILLGVLDAEENSALEAERNSPLWHTAGAGTPGDSAEPSA